MAETVQTPTVNRPGYSLGIAGFVVSFFVSLVGLVMSIIAYRQSKAAGVSNGFAVAGIVIGSLGTIVGILYAIVMILVIVPNLNTAAGM